MVSTLAHELLETVTDPFRNAWHSLGSGKEAGDLCSWQFGQTRTGSHGHNGEIMPYEYNLVGRRGVRYLVQLAYDPARQACVLQSSAAASTTALGGTGIASLF